MKKFLAYAVSGLVLVPFLAFGQDDTQIGGILNIVRKILNTLIPILITLGIIYFIYGVIQYMINANDSAKREEGRNFMIWGIVALFVITSIWGLVKLLAGTFGIGFALPQLQQ